ncbi:polyadenylation and cleavage factor-like protein 4 [Senna tora]|uniref:Polyadenylation and cleavage factor-like protein 4 n=1 Tax=Senna tora TaxID=362788 RepID=A0A834SZX2_9FABA|nr:polyadenylation and cleavage factor-like protein 4 [Senna tora]
MDSQRLLLSRENPRPLAFPTGRGVLPSATSKSMPNEIAQKPLAPSISDRFKAMLKQRDDERRASPDDDVPPPSTGEIVQLYEIVLSELTLNLKPIITELTIIAGDQREHGKGIADAICNRIIEVSVEQKLPSLYLLDSIVKNIGGEYVRYFSSRLPEVFCEAYRQVQPNLHNAMRHLFGTWSAVFPPSVLRKIEVQLQFSQAVNNQNQSSSINPPRGSEAMRRTHGIHVNPKYLRQLENSTMDTDGGEMLDSTGSIGHTNFGLGANKMHQALISRHGRVPSPSGIGLDRPLSASVEEYAVDNPIGRIVERESPSHPAFNYGLGKSIARDEELIDWPRKQYSADVRSQFPFPTNGHQRQNPRALIDAYGSDKSTVNSSNKPLVELLDMNGIDNKVVSTSWQNTEEEEFNWEDMSPTLADHRRNNGILPSSLILSRERPSGIVAATNAAALGQDTRSGWSSRSQLPPLDDSSVIAEDAFVPLGYGRGSLGQVSGLQNQLNQSLIHRQPHDVWKISHHSSNSSQHLINVRGRVRNIHLSPVDGIPNTEVNPFGLDARPPALPASFRTRPPVNVHATRPPSLNPIFPLQKHVRSQFDPINASNTIANQGPNKSSLMPERLLDSVENDNKSKVKMVQIPHQLSGPISSNQQNRGQAPQPQNFPSQDVLESQAPAASQFRSGSSLQGHGTMSNLLPVGQLPLSVQNIANNSLHLQGGALPPLFPGAPTAPSQMMPHTNASPYVSSQRPAGAFSGLINSLMAQGLISLSEQSPAQDSVGTEFNPDVLKIRHESSISALYGELPRQCTTCGLRFKCQEEHSSHMDWHVTKNRMSKNRKQKPSRKWFVSERMWLSGAEALGTESVPGFLPIETVEEKKDDEELAVPADEDQNACALCGEPFDEFYSDETEEWMYKGAVYLNAPKGTAAGMDRSQFGPIVHAKCRTESSAAPSEEFGQDDGGTIEEGSQRKRMRS